MNWEAIGAIGEVVGALGVIVTLGYLAVQIRQNTASIRASALQHMSEASASLHDLLASDVELGRIFVTGIEDLAALTPEERIRFQFTMMAFVRRAEHIHREGSRIRASADEWDGLRGSYASVMARPGFRAWWAENSHRYSPSFSEWLDDALEKRPDRQAQEGS